MNYFRASLFTHSVASQRTVQAPDLPERARQRLGKGHVLPPAHVGINSTRAFD
jgi:hypothetical protein